MDRAKNHPLHMAVAGGLRGQLAGGYDLIGAPECGGLHVLPLFIGPRPGNDTQMCEVDLLVVSSDAVRVIVEIEESSFRPTNICGKFLQSALATHFIHRTRLNAVPYADRVLFVQVSTPRSGSRAARRTCRLS